MIRECENKDIERIFEIVNDSAAAYKGIIPADRWKDPYMPKTELMHEIDAGVRFWGYEHEGELSGVMGIQDVKDVTLIRHAYVFTALRNKGIGKALLDVLIQKTTRPILIGTWTDAVWAVRFYEKNGFRLTPTPVKNRLLKKYWSIPDRQVETSVVLVEDRYYSKVTG